MIDSHCHLNFSDFDEERDEIVEKLKPDFKYVVDSGASMSSNAKSLEISRKYDGFIKSTFGYHPVYAGVDSRETIDETKRQIIDNIDNIQAIGEIGLDYAEKRSETELKQQHKVFEELLDVASEYDKPVVLHVRQAEQKAVDILKKYDQIPDVVFHCFSGTKTTALEAVDCGYYISLATNTLYSKKHKKNMKAVPLENMLTETDSPYLSPVKGQKNIPSNITKTIDRISRTKKIDFEEIEKETEKNAIRVYNL